MARDNRDSLDFTGMNIPALFVRMLVPTLLGLLFGAVLNLADGIFVGRGVGSDALAAVNVAAPIFMICTGIAMMLGSGVSVVAGIHLSRGNRKAADINMTQAVTVGLAVMTLVAAVVMAWPETFCRLFGGSKRLEPYVVDYLHYVCPSMPFIILLIEGMFIIRLDGNPGYAMRANVAASLLNIVLDYAFVFPLGMGVKGAALATTISEVCGSMAILYYLLRRSRTLHFYRPKFSPTALRLTARNTSYMARLGFSALLGELAMSFTMVAGNFAFISRLGEDGVAAYSVACYLCPLIFMFGNAIAQSALPIMSYNHGAGATSRVRQTARMAMALAFASGTAMMIAGMLLSPQIVSLFLAPGPPAALAAHGYPLYATSILFFTLNVVAIGLYQSLARAREATIFMLLRGFAFIALAFVVMPRMMGDAGLWLAIPAAETLTTLAIAAHYLLRRHAAHAMPRSSE